MDSNPDISPDYQHEGSHSRSMRVDTRGRAYGTGKEKKLLHVYG